ncbi:amidase [Nesterenkonia sp. HG001]|uniref:amidase n=1 Tax=Nesterenkonia sp. HG001 TaxID=2983207 RepID=UPI002AC70F35|nr:amidase [Nesterenkonia sp. HG001]MDZ5078088.1 amidase [Nesterenkonia sp. HG001]
MESLSAPHLPDLDAGQMASGYASGELSPVDVVDSCLHRMDALEPSLRAMYDRYDEAALAAAEASARRWKQSRPLGPLDGIPLTLKENQQVAGRPTILGSASTLPVPAGQNAPVLDRALRGGACVLGRTTMSELGMLSSGISSAHPITRNPWNLEWSPGGSSGGAGAASAAGYAPINLGSDIGGSIRLPSSWCGVAGLKPTYGRIAVDPPYPGRTIGPMGRSAADLARAMSVLAGPHPADPSSLREDGTDWLDLELDPFGLRVGLMLDIGDGAPVDPEVAALIRRAAETFVAAGAEVVEVPPYLTPGTVDLIDKFWRASHWRRYQQLAPEQQAKMLPFIADWCRAASTISAEEALEAHDAQIELGRTVLDASADLDIVLSPISPGAAFPAEWPMPSNDVHRAMEHIHFCVGYNFAGMPAASVNAGFTSEGSPVGLQIAAQRHQDRTALAAAAFFEGERPQDASRPWPRGRVTDHVIPGR